MPVMIPAAGTGLVIDLIGRELGELEEARVLVDQRRDARARQHLAAVGVALACGLVTAEPDFGEVLIKIGDGGVHRRRVLPILFASSGRCESRMPLIRSAPRRARSLRRRRCRGWRRRV